MEVGVLLYVLLLFPGSTKHLLIGYYLPHAMNIILIKATLITEKTAENKHHCKVITDAG